MRTGLIYGVVAAAVGCAAPDLPASDLPASAGLAKQSGSGCPASTPDDMVCVPGGRFVRGSDHGPDNERPAEAVEVSAFLLERTEVTVARYEACVAVGECGRLPRFPGYLASAQPAVGMRWADADAFCRWAGRRLPTEAEWERAARGDAGARYPWGDEPEPACERAIIRDRSGRGCGRGTTWPVGSRPAGPYGLHDMSGNAWEWVADHYSWCFRGCARECGDRCVGRDPQGRCGDPYAPCPESLGHRTVRGGSWWYPIDRATTTARRGVPGANPNPHRFGFRCAQDAQPMPNRTPVPVEASRP